MRKPTTYLLSGLLHCAQCGAPMSISAGTSAAYYRCQGNRTKNTCPNRVSVREDVARRWVLRAIQQDMSSPEGIAHYRKRVAEELGDWSRNCAHSAPFMVMEFLHGNDLNQILRHHGPQRPAIVVDLMLQACEGIAEAHALGIVHRDIKPSNFFITQRPDGGDGNLDAERAAAVTGLLVEHAMQAQEIGPVA